MSRYTAANCFYSEYTYDPKKNVQLGSIIDDLDDEDAFLSYEMLQYIINRCTAKANPIKLGIANNLKNADLYQVIIESDYEVRSIKKSYYIFFAIYSEEKMYLLGWEFI